ncbi:MAG: DUF2157 domain-containing protein [Candidatus Gracilibacteria bacterium]|nr:DUF2157 domain-containing protein [Candidatus Gracilibacteria bacterium]
MSDFLTQLRTESSRWQKADIISTDQKKQILARYGDKMKQYEHVEASGKITSTLSIIGAILLGIGVILFVASNWQEIPNILRVLLLLVSTLTSFSIGHYYYDAKGSYPKTGFALILLSNIMIGATIFLIAQIYNINANSSSLLLLWSIAILPMAWFYRSGMLSGLIAILMALWMPFFLSEQPVSGKEVHFFALYLGYGALYYNLGLFFMKEKTQSISAVLKGMGAMITLGACYLLTFDFIVEEVAEWSEKLTHIPLLMVSVPALVALALAYKNKESQHLVEFGVGAGVLAIAWISELFTVDAIFTAIVMNILLLGAEIGLISEGYRRKQPFLVYLALFTFTIHVFSRYFDWFFDLLDRSIFFIIGGVLLVLIGVFLEKQRKKLIDTL